MTQLTATHRAFTKLTLPRIAVAGLCLFASTIAFPVLNAAQVPDMTAGAGISGGADELETQVPEEAASRSRMHGWVHVLIELHEPPAAAAHAEALKVAQAEREAARQKALRDPDSPVSRAVLADKTAVEISPAAAQHVRKEVERLDEAQRALLPVISGPDIGGRVLYRTQRSFNGIAVLVDQKKMAALAKLAGVKFVRRITPDEATAVFETDAAGSPVQLGDGSKPAAGR